MPHLSETSLRTGSLRDHREFHEAAVLYARVFGYDSPDLQLNTNLLSALVKNGGSAVGVFAADDRLLGFAYGFAGRDRTGAEFHYSQAAVVDPEHQGEGIGRMLKHGQREVALGWGHRTMRWTFDPMLARNAHFNLSSLHAEGVAYADDYYDRPGTDRIVVDWSLDRVADPFAELRRVPVPPLGRADWGRAVPAVTEVAGVRWRTAWLPLPTSSDRPDADAAGPRVRDGLRSLLGEGHTLVACTRIDAETAAYLAVRRPDEEGA